MSELNLEFYVQRLRSNLKVFEGLLEGLSNEEAKWKPSPEKWSVLENINHLCDEEIYDFRTRLRSVLETPKKIWQPIDPPKWVIEQDYNSRNLTESFDRFRQERLDSLYWLENLKDADWNNFYLHPSGKISGGDLLVSWVGHDLLHIRQIGFLHWEILNSVCNPFDSSYAGNW